MVAEEDESIPRYSIWLPSTLFRRDRLSHHHLLHVTRKHSKFVQYTW